MSHRLSPGMDAAPRASLLAGMAAALLLGACAGPAVSPLAGADDAPSAKVAGTVPPAGGAAASTQANPDEVAAAVARARALRSTDRAEALTVLDKAAASAPADRRLHLERGLLAFELGDLAKAEKLLRQAHDPKAPDWRQHSALGAVLASRGRQQEARAEFAKALALAPDQPGVLNNLALSHALDGKTQQAEQFLRKAQHLAGKPPQVQENLALIVGLSGRYAEARTLSASAMPAAAAEANAVYLRDMARAKVSEGQGDGGEASRKAASLPQPIYQLGGAVPLR